MRDLESEKIPVGELLSKDWFFRIPEYQRPFAWDAEQFGDLIDDLTNAGRDHDYFLGTVVLHHREDAGSYDVVDGQQRLTSLLILIACLRDTLASPKWTSGLHGKIVQEENVVDGIPEKERLEVKDRVTFQKLVVEVNGTTRAPKPLNESEPTIRYLAAIQIFREKLLKLSEVEREEFAAFLSQRCVLIYLSTSDFEDAFRLFTIVNDRGKQLRRIDILKAVNLAPTEVTKETVRNRLAQSWEEWENQLGDQAYESIFHLARLIILKDKPQGDLHKEFEGRVFAKGTLQRGEPFLTKMFGYAQLYSKIFVDRDFVSTTSTNYNQWRALIHIMDAEFKASEWRACLLQYAEKFGEEGFYEFCLRIEKLYLENWVKSVRKDERYSSYSRVLGAVEAAATGPTAALAVAYDTAPIIEAAGAANLYKAGYAKYFLLRLELVTSDHSVMKEFNARSIEHVLPQNPTATGYWATNHDLTEIEEYVNSIGNLVLLSKSKNSAARNFDFDKKKTKYLRPRVTDYPRCIRVLEEDDWLKSTISKRTEEAQSLLTTDP